MLSKEVIKKLNEQVVKEMSASNLYLNMSSWCYTHRYDGAGLFLFEHAKEENSHATKLITYLNETDSLLTLDKIDKPESNFKSLLDVFERTYEHELKVTKSINELVELAFTTKDYSTFNFLQWYVAEQHEEETLFRGIKDKIKLAGDSDTSLYLIDQYIKGLAGQ
ncbi:ferritin [Helicobacter sp. 16-1353]|uniref:ferritin n=1 Tax=Helicobacter sp. 16-1353 TaxID=2004996 RepID=UPI000DCECB82|nr:ferritin [Helicobacter sp. 16-1353]RAX54945.1 ferritin [Helicobacter sp. 16-1353]